MNKVKKMISVTFVPAALTLATGCGFYSQVHEVPGDRAPVRLDRGNDEEVNFAAVKDIFARNLCLNCHADAGGNRGGINLETRASAKPLAAAIVGATASGFMPIGGPRVPAADQAVLEAWAAAGAPSVPTFADVKAAIFIPHCTGCHAGFADYARVSTNLGAIQNAIATDFMPKGGAPLSAELKALLNEWIAGGAPDGEGDSQTI